MKKLTVKKLKKLGACRSGLRRFERIFPHGAELSTLNLLRWIDKIRLDSLLWLSDELISLENTLELEQQAKELIGVEAPPWAGWLDFTRAEKRLYKEVLCILIADAIETTETMEKL